MSDDFNYHFEWDPAKALKNHRKHGVSFERAAAVFQDVLALSLFDHEHSKTEERWITLGQSQGQLLVIVHTYQPLDEHSATVRLISARSATKQERKQYESKP